MYPYKFGEQYPYLPDAENCYMRVQFWRDVVDRITDELALLEETATALGPAWKKTFAACITPEHNDGYSGEKICTFPICPGDVFLPEKLSEFNLFCDKAETNYLAARLIKRAQEQGEWNPISYGVMHQLASRQDVILPELLEKEWLVDQSDQSQYWITSKLVSIAWRISLKVPYAELHACSS